MRTLRLIRWNCRRIDPIPHSRYHPPDNELRRGSTPLDSRDLDHDADNHNHASEDDRASATDLVALDELEDGAEQAADLVDCCDEALPGFVVADFGEDVGERGGGYDA
jgi:hypothetical protein